MYFISNGTLNQCYEDNTESKITTLFPAQNIEKRALAMNDNSLMPSHAESYSQHADRSHVFKAKTKSMDEEFTFRFKTNAGKEFMNIQKPYILYSIKVHSNFATILALVLTTISPTHTYINLI